MTRRKGVATVVPISGKRGTSYRVEWWFAGTRRRTPSYNDRTGGRARAYAIADLVDKADGDMTADEADKATRPGGGDDAPAADLPTTLGYWLDRWLETNRAPEKRTRTIYAYQVGYLTPYRNGDVVSWDAGTSQDVYDDLLTRYAASTTSVAFDRLQAALSLAHKAGVRAKAPKRPAEDVESPGIALEDDELDAILAAASADPELFDVVSLMIQTGMRIGEVCALQPADLDRRRGGVNVRRTVKADQKDVGKPKNGKNGRRLIIVDPAKASPMWATLVRRADAVPADGYLFHRRIAQGSSPWDPTLYALPQSMRGRWNALVRKPLAGVVPDGVRLHDLRHTSGSILLASGEFPPTAVANRLGMSLTMLETVYGHDLVRTVDGMGSTMDAWRQASTDRKAAARRAAIHVV